MTSMSQVRTAESEEAALEEVSTSLSKKREFIKENVHDKIFISRINSHKYVQNDALNGVDSIKNDGVMVGRSTRIPKVLTNYLGDKKPVAAAINGVKSNKAIVCEPADQVRLFSKVDTRYVLTNVTPLSLGIRVIGGFMSVIIPKNSVIPIKKTAIYTTFYDYQTSVYIDVYEGERPMAKSNNFVASFTLVGIEKKPRHVPKIEITFKIEDNYILHATARDKATGKKISIEHHFRDKLLSK